MLKKSAVVLASCKETLQMAELGGAGNVSLVLPAGLPDSFFPETKATKTPAEGTLKLLWVGRFQPRKGTLLLLDIMKTLRDYPSITLTVVGDGEMREEFLATVEKYGLHETVHSIGPVPFEEIRDCYAEHDAFLFTSLRDACPAQVIEAMAFGLPVLTLDLHGQSQLVGSDRGIKSACDTPEMAIENLKAAILELYGNPALVEKLSAGSFRFAAEQTWDTKIDSIVDRFYNY